MHRWQGEPPRLLTLQQRRQGAQIGLGADRPPEPQPPPGLQLRGEVLLGDRQDAVGRLRQPLAAEAAEAAAQLLLARVFGWGGGIAINAGTSR
jgi:hypothetical protein